jgi:hypothetical protein
MKKLCYILMTMMFPLLMVAQSIPNGDFEEWTIIEYAIPDQWNTSATENLMDAGFVASTEVSGYINSAIHLETMTNEDELIPAYFSNTDGDPVAGEGGVPYNGSPTGITGYYRYHLPALDTALMIVICKSGGSISSFDLFKIKGTGDQPEFTAFNFALTNAAAVDTVIIAATSSNLITEEGIEIGSWIEFDQLAFTGESPVMPPIPNGSFDEWNSYTWDRPIGWNTRGSNISLTTDSYSGEYAIQLVNEVREDGSIDPSTVTTSDISDGPPVGGLPYSNVSDTLCGYYKFIAPEGQFAAVSAVIYASGNNIGGNYLQLAPADSYTYFEMPLNTFSLPDTLGVEITSAAWPFDDDLEGNTLIVDHVQLKSAPLNTSEISHSGLSLFPNPVRNELTIKLASQWSTDDMIFIYNQSGQCVYSALVTQSQMMLDTSFLTAGLYSYKIGNDKAVSAGQFIVIK